MIITKKIKTINKKIEQNKAQYDLHKQTAKSRFYHLEILVKINF